MRPRGRFAPAIGGRPTAIGGLSLFELQAAVVLVVVAGVINAFILVPKLPRDLLGGVPQCAMAAARTPHSGKEGSPLPACPDSDNRVAPGGVARGLDGGGSARVIAGAGPAGAWSFELRSSWGWWVLLAACGAGAILGAVVALRDRRDELAAGWDVEWTETLGRAAIVTLLLWVPLLLVFAPTLAFTGRVAVMEDGTVRWGGNLGAGATRPAAAVVAVVAEHGVVRIVVRDEEGSPFALRLPQRDEAATLAARLRDRIASGASR